MKISEKKGKIIWIAAAALLLIAAVIFHFLAPSGKYPVQFHEILMGNTRYPNEEGRCCDYIELHNSADYAVDLTGFQIGDIADNARYVFPTGTVIEAGGYYVVYCDSLAENSAYAPFGLSRSGGEDLYLIASNRAIVDHVTTIAADLDEPMVRAGNDLWEPADFATPGFDYGDDLSSGRDIYNAEVSPVRITEYTSSDMGYVSELGLHCDWVELFNTAPVEVDISGYILTDNVGNDKYVFAQGTTLAPQSYLVVDCLKETAGKDAAPFGISQFGGETLVLKNSGRMIIEIIDTIPADSGQSVALGEDGNWNLTDLPSPGCENTSAGHVEFLSRIGAEPGTVVISEVCAAAHGLLPDTFGEFSDWVELHNTGTQAVDLSGWYLSDDGQFPHKWSIPSLILQPDGYAVIFCSERGGEGMAQAGFSLSSGGEEVLLTSYAGTPVDQVKFGQAQSNASFVFGAGEATLSESPTPGFSNDAEGYEAFWNAQTSKGPLAIWEVMTSNEEFLPQALGECYDWLELRNISDQEINLSNFSITDDPDDPKQYILPNKTLEPGGYMVVILSGDVNLSDYNYDHATFALNAKEDQVFLYDHEQNLVDHVYLKDIPVGYSYGRQEGRGGFFYCSPSPKTANESGTRQISTMPTSDIAPGVYTPDETVSVGLQAIGDIYYTTDGSDPDASSLLYTAPITVDQTMVLRAVSVEPGKLPSDIYTATFVMDDPHDLPIVSLVTDPDNLWGPKGIYKNGDMTIKEQKRSAHVSYLGDDGSFGLNCELSLHGATTVTAFNKKSFSVRFQDAYDGPLYYDVFEDGEVTAFRSLIIRAAHESTFSSHMRDVLMAHIAANNCDTLLCQKYKYVALYLNGSYWGLYAFRELHSEAHYASYMDVPASAVSMVRYCSDGQNSLFDLYNRCADKSYLISEENFNYAKTVLDMSSVIDWIIMEAYVGNFDIHGNMRYYYNALDGLWRCGLVDVDLGMFSPAAFDETATSFHHGQLVDALLQNEEFQCMMAERLAELLSGPMSDESMFATIDQIAAIIRPEVPMEGERWGCTPEMWEKLVVEMKDYCNGRAATMINSLCGWVGFTQEEKTVYFGDLL